MTEKQCCPFCEECFDTKDELAEHIWLADGTSHDARRMLAYLLIRTFDFSA